MVAMVRTSGTGTCASMLQMALRMASDIAAGSFVGADDEGAGVVGAIGERHVDHGGRLLAEIDGADIADHADDLEGLFIGIAATEELADGILAVPGDLRGALGDDGDVFAEIVLGEEAAGDERDLHGFEVAGAEPAVLGVGT